MKVRKIFFLLILLMKISYSQNSDNFYFTRVLNHVPYIIVNDEELVKWIELSLNKKQLTGFVEIDSSTFETVKGLGLYYTSESKDFAKCYRLKFNSKIPPFLKNKYLFQIVKKDGSGKQLELLPEKVLYHSKGKQNFVLIKCKRIEEDKYNDIYPTAILKNKTSLMATTINFAIPKRIRSNITRSEEWFFKNKKPIFTKLSMEENIKRNGNSNVLPVYLKNKKKYFVNLISYGHKGIEGYLQILTENGERVDQIYNNKYATLYGITDVNRDGNHEIIAKYSYGDYQSGIAIILIEKNENKIVTKLVSKIATSFD